MHSSENQVIKEIWDNCGEYLELIPQKHWRSYMTPVLIRLLAKARDEIDYLRKRLDHVDTARKF